MGRPDSPTIEQEHDSLMPQKPEASASHQLSEKTGSIEPCAE